ncbi:reverse transcriptase domain-containing protein [Tanacetum coccineum]
MADNRTMAQMLQAPIEGYEDAIVVPPINANNFELKQLLITLCTVIVHGTIPHVSPSEEEESIFMEIPKPKAKKIVNVEIQDLNSPKLILPEKLEDPGKFLIPCALQELNRTSALADSGASINLLPHSIYKQLGLEALTPTRMTLELANRSVMHPMGIAEDVVVSVDGFTFLADFVVVNFEPDPRVHFILGRPFFRTAKALIDLYEEKLTLRVGKEELVYYADKSKKNKDKHFVHAISVIDFSKDEPFSGNTINPLFDEMEEDVECFAPEDDIDEIDAFLAIEVSSKFEKGYFDSEGDVTFLDNLLSDDTTHNLASEVISDHEPEQNESSITFSPKSDPLHHEFAGEPLTLPSRNNREFRECLSLVIVLYEISTSQSQENVHQSSVIESLPVSPIPIEDSNPVQEEIDIFLVPDDLIPPGVENDDSEDEDNELPNLDHQDDPSIPRPPPEPPDIEKCLEPEAGILIIKVFKDVSKPHNFMTVILPTLPTLVSDLTFILISSFFSFGSEDTIFDPGIVTFHKPVAFSMEVSCVALPKDN